MIIQVDLDRLTLTVTTEGHHVLMRVEGHTVESSGVTELIVDCNLVTWGKKTHCWYIT